MHTHSIHSLNKQLAILHTKYLAQHSSLKLYTIITTPATHVRTSSQEAGTS